MPDRLGATQAANGTKWQKNAGKKMNPNLPQIALFSPIAYTVKSEARQTQTKSDRIMNPRNSKRFMNWTGYVRELFVNALNSWGSSDIFAASGLFPLHVFPRVARKLATLGFEPECFWDSSLPRNLLSRSASEIESQPRSALF